MTPAEWPIGVNVAVFVVAAGAVWFAGTRLAHYADAIAEATGMGRAFLGMLMLGSITSLPEIAVAATATLQGTPLLSVSDVLGSAAINVVILAIADACFGRAALTSVQGSPAVILQGVLSIVLFAIILGSGIAGNPLVFGMGAWSWLMLLAYLGALWLVAHSNAAKAWTATRRAPTDRREDSHDEQKALRTTVWKSIGAASVILVAGFALARCGDALAEQTGLGTGFFGMVFLGFATSLPEVITVIAAVRLGRYDMAIGEIFGTNLFNVTIIVLVDALYRGEPILNEAGAFASFGAFLGLMLTAFFMVGLLERRDRTFLRMGLDSLAVIGTYGVGVVVLHGLS